MKNLILIIGSLLIALNTFSGFIFSGYQPLNYWLANLSIALTTAIIYIVAYSKMANGFKIGLTTIFPFTGVVRYVCLIPMPSVFENNVYIIVAASIFLFEVVCVTVASFASRK